MMKLFGRSARGLLGVINRHSSGRAETKNKKTLRAVDTSRRIQNNELQKTGLREYCCERILNGWGRSPEN
jgi:DNA-directed RNA polymerase subunit N (RpoN/RPB10)